MNWYQWKGKALLTGSTMILRVMLLGTEQSSVVGRRQRWHGGGWQGTMTPVTFPACCSSASHDSAAPVLCAAQSVPPRAPAVCWLTLIDADADSSRVALVIASCFYYYAFWRDRRNVGHDRVRRLTLEHLCHLKCRDQLLAMTTGKS